LQTAALRKAITAVAGISYGLFSILFLTVVVGVKLTQQIDFGVPGGEFQAGLVVFFSMPTTINSGIVLTQQVKPTSQPPNAFDRSILEFLARSLICIVQYLD